MDHSSETFCDFLALSVVITGFSEYELRGTGQAEFYFATVTRIIGEKAMHELCQAYCRIQQTSHNDQSTLERGLRSEILSHDKFGPVVRNVIRLWYVGTWYQLPYEWRDTYGTRDDDRTFVVSPVAYTEGLLWPTIGANPPGAKGPGYGSWTNAPRIADL